MDPLTSMTPYQQPLNMNMLVPGFYASKDDQEIFLSSLDSDTREYVETHPNEFRSKDDILEFMNRMKSDS